MIQYLVGGVAIRSALPLPELAAVKSKGRQRDGVLWTIERGRGHLDESAGPGDVEVSANQSDWPAVAQLGDGYLLKFANLAKFTVHPSSRRIVCHLGPEHDDGMTRHLLLDQVVPRALSLERCLVLHASAVLTHGGVVAFCGASGSGKSTLAASFLAQGCPVMADDFLVLRDDGCRLRPAPSYPGLRLWPDSAASMQSIGRTVSYAKSTAKGRVSIVGAQGIDDSVPLAAVVILGEARSKASGLRIERLRGHQAMMNLFGQTFRLGSPGPIGSEREFDQFARLVESTAVLSADFPRDYAGLPALRAAILNEVPIPALPVA